MSNAAPAASAHGRRTARSATTIGSRTMSGTTLSPPSGLLSSIATQSIQRCHQGSVIATRATPATTAVRHWRRLRSQQHERRRELREREQADRPAGAADARQDRRRHQEVDVAGGELARHERDPRDEADREPRPDDVAQREDLEDQQPGDDEVDRQQADRRPEDRPGRGVEEREEQAARVDGRTLEQMSAGEPVRDGVVERPRAHQRPLDDLAGADRAHRRPTGPAGSSGTGRRGERAEARGRA